ncbi:hypothetical protein Goarm_012997, partial [Gossypium armourianum]|nr:hypothetical protein [Gossypium armourianum]
MAQWMEVLEVLLLLECCVIRMGIGSWGLITSWGNVQFFRLNYGVLNGILILDSKGFKRVTIQTDNLEVAKTLQGSMMADLGIIVYDDAPNAPNKVLEALQQDRAN